MTSFANFAQNLGTSLPSTSAAAAVPGPSRSPVRRNEAFSMTSMLCNLMENMNPPVGSYAGRYDIWADGPARITTVNSYNQKEDNSSAASPGTSSSPSLTCYRCEERSPTTRCIECNEIYCYECCHNAICECQRREHTLVSINQISPIGVRPNSVTRSVDKEAGYCDTHNEPVCYYCETCIAILCSECILWIHKDHSYKLITGALEECHSGIEKVLEETKVGSQAIRMAIDRAIAMNKTYEKECAEAMMKIKKAMRCFVQVIEDRERYLLDKVERIRQMKVNEINDHMNTLRGILAGLAHTNENLAHIVTTDIVDLFSMKEKATQQVEYFSAMFKNMYIKQERIAFYPPGINLIDQLRNQGDVQTVSIGPVAVINPPANSPKTYEVYNVALPPPPYRPAHTYPPVSIPMSVRSSPDYSNAIVPVTAIARNDFFHGVDVNGLGIGQAVPGSWMPVVFKPARSSVPGIPMLSFAREGPYEGQVSRPWGLCVDNVGNIIVADRRNNRIQIFNATGIFQTMFGCKGTGPGEFDLPAGITTDVYGRIIVVDKDNHRVQIFTMGGVFLLKFGCFGKECGQFQYPWDVAVNTVGNIVVTDTRNHRIQLFANDGTFITKFEFEDNSGSKILKGPTTPRGISFTMNGNVIVSDFENHRLLVVDKTFTKVLQCMGREGSCIGELNRPSGIVIDDEGRVIVADSKNHRLLVMTWDLRVISVVDLKSPGLDDKDRPSDVALTPEGYLVVLFETLPDTPRENSCFYKQYIKVY